jgi:polysaccharide pyruvyl transferase CsaB
VVPKTIRAVISGYYGFGNTGDETILQALIGLLHRDPRLHITVISANPRRTAHQHGVLSVNRLDFFGIVKAVARSRILVSGGGGLLQDVTSSRSLLYYLGIIGLGLLFHKPVILLSQSVGPIHRSLNRRFTRWMVNRSSVITVRDEASLKELSALGVKRPSITLTADLALMLDPISSERTEELLKHFSLEPPFVLFCLRRLKGQQFPLDLFVRTVSTLQQAWGTRMVFLPFQASFDLSLAQSLARSIPQGLCLDGTFAPAEIVGLLSRAELVVGMRLHALIFAAKARTPFVALSYDPKVKAFADLLEQEALPYDSLCENIFFGKLAQTWQNRFTIKKDLDQKVSRLEVRAEDNWKSLESLLKLLG